MRKHINRVVNRIQSSPSQAPKVLMTIGVYTALFLVLLHAHLVNQKEFLKAFSDAFLTTWFLSGLLVLLLVLFLLKDTLPLAKELFTNTAESIYGSMVLITSFAFSGYLYSIPASRKILLVHKAGFLMAVIVYFLITVFLKKLIHSMAGTRKLEEKMAFVLLVCATIGVTWFAKNF